MKTILLIIACLGAIPVVLSQSAEQYQSKVHTQDSKKFYTKIYHDNNSKHPESDRKIFKLPNGKAGDNISHWKWQNILPQGNNLNSITIAYTPKNGAEEFVGYGVGNYRTVVKSSLSGNGWQDLSDNLPTHSNLSSVSFADSQTGITAANDGFVFLTYNGGASWDYEVPNDFSAITCVQMINHNDVYLCEEDGEIFYSSDGGINWIPQALLDLPRDHSTSNLVVSL